MFAANREPGTQRREWRRDARDEMEGKGEINPCHGNNVVGWVTDRRPTVPAAKTSPPHKASPQPSPIQGQQNIEPRFPHQSIPALSHPLILYTTATSRGIPKIQTQYPFYSQYATSVRFLDKITDAPQPTRGFLVLFVSLVILLVLAVFLCVLDTPYAAKVSRCNPFMLSQTHLAQSTAPSGGWYLFPTCRLLLHDVPLTQPG